MDYDELVDILNDNIVGMDIELAEDLLRNKLEDFCMVDENIDDGIDDDVYLMMRSYDADNNDIRMYYADDDYKVSDFNVQTK